MKAIVIFVARYARVVLLGAWFHALGTLVGEDRYEAFLRPEFVWLLGLAALVLLAFLLVELGRLGQRGVPTFAGGVRWLMLMAPLAYLPVAAEVMLDGGAFETRWTGGTVNDAARGLWLADRAEAAAADRERTVTLADLCWDAERYNGRRIVVDGMLKRLPEISEEFGADACLLYRFVVTCCVADAIPAAILLRGSVPPEWGDDTWVRAEGTFALELQPERDVIRLDVDRLEKTERPGRPYLY